MGALRRNSMKWPIGAGFRILGFRLGSTKLAPPPSAVMPAARGVRGSLRTDNRDYRPLPRCLPIAGIVSFYEGPPGAIPRAFGRPCVVVDPMHVWKLHARGPEITHISGRDRKENLS
jgi:hypothetical protein